MEEAVGKLWHRVITSAAQRRYPHAAVTLEEMAGRIGVLFRAFGGDGVLRVVAADEVAHGARRRVLHYFAGTDRKVALAWRDGEALHLPICVDTFPARELNRFLYLWLAALAAADSGEDQPWFERNRTLAARVLDRWPGLRLRYQALAQAAIALRPDPNHLPVQEAAREHAIRNALRDPTMPVMFPDGKSAPAPVLIWLRPDPPGSAISRTAGMSPDAKAESGRGAVHDARDRRRRRAERVAMPRQDAGLLALRMEALFGLADYVPVDRGTDDDDEPENAARNADDLDLLSVAQSTRASSNRVRFDLDLPSSASDDLSLGEGILLPEWDYRQRRLLTDHCRIEPLVAADAVPAGLPPRLQRLARRVRNEFQMLALSRTWHRAQPEGVEIDLDACTRLAAERAAGAASASDRLFRDLHRGGRDLACLVLADLSLSTDAAVNNELCVIDVIRDGLFLLCEALAASGDRFGLFGFSSCRRNHIRFHLLKGFGESYGATVRGRLAALRPGFYTRMGAALRHATRILARQTATKRLLIMLTDGKPNDIDHYEGRYGIEDTRMALHEARQAGLQPFCVTVDAQGSDYLPYLFGSSGYVVIKRAEELPLRLLRLYAQLTR